MQQRSLYELVLLRVVQVNHRCEHINCLVMVCAMLCCAYVSPIVELYQFDVGARVTVRMRILCRDHLLVVLCKVLANFKNASAILIFSRVQQLLHPTHTVI